MAWNTGIYTVDVIRKAKKLYALNFLTWKAPGYRYDIAKTLKICEHVSSQSDTVEDGGDYTSCHLVQNLPLEKHLRRGYELSKFSF